jgi:hypothetical protein
MGANLDFIESNIVGHVSNWSNAQVATAFQGCTEANCDVRSYGASGTPDWARFWSESTRSPQGGFWWLFELVGDIPVNEGGPVDPAASGPPWWKLGDDEAMSLGDAEPRTESEMPGHEGKTPRGLESVDGEAKDVP